MVVEFRWRTLEIWEVSGAAPVGPGIRPPSVGVSNRACCKRSFQVGSIRQTQEIRSASRVGHRPPSANVRAAPPQLQFMTQRCVHLQRRISRGKLQSEKTQCGAGFCRLPCFAEHKGLLSHHENSLGAPALISAAWRSTCGRRVDSLWLCTNGDRGTLEHSHLRPVPMNYLPFERRIATRLPGIESLPAVNWERRGCGGSPKDFIAPPCGTH